VKLKLGRRIRLSKFLYRKAGLAVIFAALWGIAFSATCRAQASQEEQGAEIAPQAKKPKKKGRDPRAIGLLQLLPNGKTTLIPIAILMDGKFYDASAYKATPVPMVLESGTVYEAIRTGKSVGLFTVTGAGHSKDPASQNPWIGTGSFLATGAEAPKGSRKAENVPLGLDEKDAPPRLSRGGGTEASKGSAPTEPAATQSPASAGSGGTSPAGASTDKPAGAKPPSSSAPGSDRPPQTAQTGSKQGETSPSGEQTTPTNGAKANEQKPGNQPSVGQSGKPPEQTGHPTLRRGKPTQPLPDDDQSKSANDAATKGGVAATESGDAKNVGAQNTAELVPAISDVSGPDPQSYAFDWPKGREEERRKQMVALAASEIRAYLATQAKKQIGSASESKQTPATVHKTTAKQAQPVIEKVQLRAFDLWGNSDPILIMSAEAHLPPASRSPAAKESWKEDATATAPDSASSYTITLVAKTDIYGNLRKLYSGVTDKYHLDVTPKLELIDAVDADGDGRGELLFRETSDAGTGYVIYRATADTLWKMFDSLNQE
jgi:hypothetical protein